MKSIEFIKGDLKNRLSDKRYQHSLRVADEACKLAKIYGVLEENAYIAGLVHDVAKEFSSDENKYWVDKYQLPYDILKDNYKKIVHAEVGALVAGVLYEVNDDVKNAIKYHTIGNINMSLLDKIVFIADKIECGKNYPGIEDERVLAYKNIDKALQLCLENNKKKLESEGKVFHHASLNLLNALKEKNI